MGSRAGHLRPPKVEDRPCKTKREGAVLGAISEGRDERPIALPQTEGAEPALLSLPAEALMRMGKRRLPQGRGRHTTAFTECTCPVCTAAGAATAVKPASRPPPTPSAMPRSPSTCELWRLGQGPGTDSVGEPA